MASYMPTPQNFNWSPGLNTAVPSVGQGGSQMYGPQNFGQPFQGGQGYNMVPSGGGQMYGGQNFGAGNVQPPGAQGLMYSAGPMQQALGAMARPQMQGPNVSGMNSLASQNPNDPYFAGRAGPAYARQMGAPQPGMSRVPGAQPFSPFGGFGQGGGGLGGMMGGMNPQVMQALQSFIPQRQNPRGAPMTPPPGITGDPMTMLGPPGMAPANPMGGLFGGAGAGGMLGGLGGGMNPQILQAIMAMFGGGGRGR